MDVLSTVRWITLPSNSDTRGVLTSIESGLDIPFAIKRIFYMHHIVADRGGMHIAIQIRSLLPCQDVLQ